MIFPSYPKREVSVSDGSWGHCHRSTSRTRTRLQFDSTSRWRYGSHSATRVTWSAYNNPYGGIWDGPQGRTP